MNSLFTLFKFLSIFSVHFTTLTKAVVLSFILCVMITPNMFAQACTITDLSVTITHPCSEGTFSERFFGSVVVNATVDNCNGGLEYSANGGQSWSTDNNLNSFTAADYTLTVRCVDQPDCLKEIDFTVSKNSFDLTEGTSEAESCSGKDDGKITFVTSGDCSGTPEFSTDNGVTFGTANPVTDLAPGTYNIVARCSSSPNCVSDAMEVTVNASTEVCTCAITNFSLSTVPACATENGKIIVSASADNCDGMPEYSLDGTNFQSSNILSVAAGTHIVVARCSSQSDCVAVERNVVVTESDVCPCSSITISEVTPAAPGCQGDNGTITVSANANDNCNGMLEYSTDGTTFQSSNTLSVPAGTYSVFVRCSGETDCMAQEDNVTVQDGTGTKPVVTIQSIQPPSCSCGDDGTFSLNVSGECSGVFQFTSAGNNFWIDGISRGNQRPGFRNIVIRCSTNPTCISEPIQFRIPRSTDPCPVSIDCRAVPNFNIKCTTPFPTGEPTIDNCSNSPEFAISMTSTDPTEFDFCDDSSLTFIRRWVLTENGQAVQGQVCEQRVLIFADILGPTIETGCSSEVTKLGCDDPLPAAKILGDFTLSDNCTEFEPSSFRVTLSPVTGRDGIDICSEDDADRTVTRIYTFEDGCGNASTCEEAFLYNRDIISPTADCPGTITVDAGLDCNSPVPPPGIFSVAEFIAKGGTSEDNCSESFELSITFEDSSEALDFCSDDVEDRRIRRLYTITDACGNEGICSQFIIYNQDTDGPEILNCPADMVMNVDAGLCEAVVKLPIPIAIDNCGGDNTVTQELGITDSDNNSTTPFAGDDPTQAQINIDAGETLSVKFTIGDECGNESECAYEVTIQDNNNPNIICPENVVVCAIEGCRWESSGLQLINTFEECDFSTSAVLNSSTGGTSNFNGDIPDGTDFRLGTSTITYTITEDLDEANSVSCNFTVTVEDCNPAVVNDIRDFSIECLPNHDIGSFGFYSFSDLFPGSTPGGTIRQSGGPNGGLRIIRTEDTNAFAALQVFLPGCYEVEYVVEGFCGVAFEQTRFIVGEQPEPVMNIADDIICWYGGDPVTIKATVNSPDYASESRSYRDPTQAPSVTRTWTVDPPSGIVSISNNGEITIMNPGLVKVCYEENITVKGCFDDDMECISEVCQFITIVDGLAINPDWDSFGPVCTDSPKVDLTARVTGDGNGVFTGNGVTGTHPMYEFDPSAINFNGEESVDVTICYVVGNDSSQPILDGGGLDGGGIVIDDGGAVYIGGIDVCGAIEIRNPVSNGVGAGCGAVECHTIRVYDAVDATIEDLQFACTVAPSGNVSLDALFTANTTPGGVFSGAGVVGNTLQYDAAGCYEITYTITAFEGATGACTATDKAFILIPEQPTPRFTIQDQVCFSDGDESTSHVYSPILHERTSNNLEWSIQSGSTATGSVAANGDVTVTSIGVLIVCVTETNGIAFQSCGTNPTPMSESDRAFFCTETYCTEINISDGTTQDASFAISDQDQCPGTEITLTANTSGGAFSGNGVTDGGDGETATVSIPSDCSSVDVTYTLNDVNGCTSSATQTVFGDRIPPVINAAGLSDIVLECNDPDRDNDAIIESWLNRNAGAVATDDCTFTWSYDLIAETDGCSTTGSGTYRFTATDQCGNSSSVIASIVIVDRTDPVVTVPSDLTISCDDIQTIQQSIEGWLNQATATDDCSIPVVTHDYETTSLDLCTANTIAVEFTARDVCGNISFKTANIIIEGDLEDPVVTAPEELSISCMDLATSESTIEGWLNQATATDDCSEEPVISHDYEGTVIDLCVAGTIPVTFTATDLCGNTHSQTVNIVIEGDLEDPVVTAPEELSIGCMDLATSESTIEGWLNQATATDDCSEPVITHDYEGTVIDLCVAGTIPVTFTATDLCGKTHSQTVNIVIEGDLEDPVVTAPEELSISCIDLATSESTIEGWLNQATATDDCSEPVISHDYEGTVIDLCVAGTIPVIFTATDLCGKTHSQTVNIVIEGDLEDPVITPPAALTITCEQLSETDDPSALIAGFLNSATGTDDCSDPVISHDFTGNLLDICTAGVITVNFTATDLCGKTHTLPSTITIDPDSTAPTFTSLPADLDLDCNDINETTALTVEGWLNNVTISDDCDSDPVLTHDYTTESLDLCDGDGTSITVTWTATDACGNSDFVTAVLTVTPDVSAPTFLTEPADLNLDCSDIGETTAVTIEGWLNAVTIEDMCDTDPVLTHDFTTQGIDLCDAEGASIVVTWTGTDACGNTDSRSATLTITPDTAPPVLTVPDDLTITCSEISATDDPSALVAAFLSSTTAVDLCDTDPVITHDYDGTALDVCTTQLITVTFTATDACGNSDSEEATIEVVPDTTAPDLVCPAGTTNNTDFYTCEGDLEWMHPLPTDACGIVIYTYTVTDPDGTVNGPFDLLGILSTEEATTNYDFEEDLNDGTGSIVSYYVEDFCGNSSECSFDVHVLDDLDPYFADCPSMVMVSNDPDQCSAFVNWDVPIAFDNCDNPDGNVAGTLDEITVVQTAGPAPGTEIAVGTHTVVYTATDDEGNTARCEFDVIVKDTECPEFITTLPENITLECDLVSAPFELIPESHLSDNCTAPIDIVVDFTELISDGVFPVFNVLSRTWTITDEAGNSCHHTQTISVIDNALASAPTLSIPDDITIESCQVAFDTIMVPKVIILDTVEQLVAIGDDWILVNEVIKKDTFDLQITPIYIDPTMGFQATANDKSCLGGQRDLEVSVREETEFICKGIKAAVIFRIYEAADEFGNITVDTQRIEVLDPNPPVLVPRDTVTVSIGPDGHVNLEQDDVILSVFDACFGDASEINVDISPNYFNCSQIGQHVVLVAATDPCNNMTAYEEVVVNIVDDIAPSLTCPAGVVNVSIDPTNCDAAFNQILDIVSGNDCDVTISTSPPLDASIDMNTSVITVIATDASGNISFCDVSVNISLTDAIDFNQVLSCNDRVNISLNNECWYEISPDLILEGSPDVCTELLCIEVEDGNGNDHLNFFDITDVGQVFKVRVVDCNGSGNSCWSEVLLDEKQIPEIVWPRDTVVLCVEPTDTSYFKIGIPEIENCEPVITMEYEDSYVEYDQCSTPRATITRKWTVSDDEGNVAVDTQYIDIMPFSNQHVRFPADITIVDPIDCKLVTEMIDDIENNVLDPGSYLHPDSTGLPNIFGLPLQTTAGLCLFSLGYEDEVLEICDGSYEVLRTWKVKDVCTSVVDELNPITHTQVITVYDNDGPVLDSLLIPQNDTLSYNPWECAYAGSLYVPQGDIESCGSVFFEAYVTGGGYIVTEGSVAGGDLAVFAVGFDEGDHWVTYVYSDGCDNVSIYKHVITVIDEVEPVAVCQDNISVTVTTDGVAKIYSTDIDGGSHDAGCGPVSSCVVRMVDFEAGYLGKISGHSAYVSANGCQVDGEFRDTIFDKFGEIDSITILPFVLCKDEMKICCTDLGEQRIVLEVSDNAGLSNVCMADITVVDKSNASLVCEPHEIDCTDDKDSDLLQPVGASSICGDDLPLAYFDEEEFIDGCGEGQIFRVWYLDADNNGTLDEGEISCNQVITVSNSVSFDPYSLKWPKHYTGEIQQGKNLECNNDVLTEFDADIPMGGVFTCSATDPGDEPIWCNTSCGLVGVSSEVDTVTAGDACLQLIKRWTVIDWCFWEANAGSPGDAANDTDNDSFEPVEDWAQGVCAGCAENVSQDPVYFRYTEVDVDGYYTYDQVIKIVDETAPEVITVDVVVNTTGGAASKDDDTACSGTGAVIATASDLCGSEEISGELLSWVITYDNGSEKSITNAHGPELTMETQAGSPGDVHIVEFVVRDGCGNRSSATSTITFGDEKKPTPICVSGLTTAFMETDGTVEVWAKDFDLGSFDNCSEIQHTIIKSGETPLQPSEDGFADQANIEFNCDDLASLHSLEVWVWDAVGNGDFCTTQVLISGSCDFEPGNGAMISGQVRTEIGEMIEDVQMSIETDDLDEYPRIVSTDELGEYVFDKNPVGLDYTITAEKNLDYLNGVTTADLLAIQQHITGIRKFKSPYQTIAADINNDEIISAFDLVVLRKAVLGLIDKFDRNKSWRFVDAAQVFENASDPWPFLDLIEVADLNTNMTSEDFIGVKIGDVNGSARANSLANSEIRSTISMEFSVDNSEFIKGEAVRVNVTIDHLKELAGFQFTLDHSGLVFQSVESGIIDLTNEHIGIHDGVITASWETLEAVVPDDVLFTLVFESLENQSALQLLEINSDITKSEAYASSGDDAYDLVMNLDVNDTDQLILAQNDPNPFYESTVVRFTMPETETAEFSIYSSNGTLIYQMTEVFDHGNHQILVDRTMLNDYGVYFYMLNTAHSSIIKKMVFLK